MKLGEFIKDRRQELGLKQQDVASHLGYTRMYVSFLENNLRNVHSNRNLVLLGEILQTDPWYIFYLAGKVPPELQDINMSKEKVVHMFNTGMISHYGAG